MNNEVQAYNDKQPPDRQAICLALHQELMTGLPDAECKLWHGAPVWFLDGNPIVGYHGLKKYIRLLFWSGQSFEAPGLIHEGTFKAAGARYTSAEQIDPEQIQRWLKDAREIQWDYQNLMKVGDLRRIH